MQMQKAGIISILWLAPIVTKDPDLKVGAMEIEWLVQSETNRINCYNFMI